MVKATIHSVSRRAIASSALAVLTCAAQPAYAGGVCSPVMDWNQAALAATATAGQGAVPQIRSMAIVQVSVYDAVNAVTHEHGTYLRDVTAPDGATAEAAAIGAGYYALTHLFGAQTATFDGVRATTLEACAVAATDPGLDFGGQVAALILARRAGDASALANSTTYSAPGAGLPGVWVPVGAAPTVSPAWGTAVPWVLRSGSQFRPDAPDALSSERYTTDFIEVKSLGSLASTARTDEQKQIALFWNGTPSAIWNGVARQVISSRNLDVSDSARTLALMYLSAVDASIACFEAKYTYNFWRPITAIRRADEDGNDATGPDASWVPLITTHQHPEYPSAHATNSSAMAMALGLLFGDDPGLAMTVSSPGNPGFTRTWTAFSQGVAEVEDARVYIGFHFRNSTVVGARVGRQVARFVFTHALGQ